MSTPAFVRVLPLRELKRGTMRSVQLGAREIVLCHTRAGIFALDNICTHARTRMSEGELKGDRLVCPLHGACFDVRSGAVIAGPAVLSLGTYAVRVIDDEIEVQISEVEISAALPRER